MCTLTTERCSETLARSCPPRQVPAALGLRDCLGSVVEGGAGPHLQPFVVAAFAALAHGLPILERGQDVIGCGPAAERRASGLPFTDRQKFPHSAVLDLLGRA
jgi:hypothetical protein